MVVTKPRVLVVEDETVIALDLCSRLRELGYEVVGTAVSANEAVELARRERPELVLMDIALKGSEDGISAARRLRGFSAVPIIFITAHADDTTLQRAKEIEPDGYIIKPFENLDLKVAITLAWHRHRPRPGEPVGEVPPAKRSLIESALSGDPQAKRTLVAGVPLFSVLGSGLIDQLAENAECRELSARGILYSEGGDNQNPLVVLTGRLALGRASESGRELIVDLLYPGDLLGLAFALDEPRLTLSARAQVASTVLLFPADAISALFKSYPRIEHTVLRALSSRVVAAYELSRALAHDRVEQRIVSMLVTIAKRHGISAMKDTVSLPLTRQELADLTGVAIETSIRVTKDLEAAGLLDLTQRGVITIPDLETLEKYRSAAG